MTPLRLSLKFASNTARGRWAEARAARELRRSGYIVLERNFRCSRGEIDLIADHRGTRCFVEVKARSRGDFGGALQAVDRHKQRRVQGAAEVYLAREGYSGACRFDVVTLEPTHDGWRVEIVPDAFECS